MLKKEGQRQACGMLGLPGCDDGASSNGQEKDAATAAIEMALLQSQLSTAQRSPNPSPHQSQLHTYSDSYTMQGAGWGGLAGAIAGCLVADYLLDGSCSEGAIYGTLIGGTVGAVAGSRVGQRQEVYRDRELALRDKLTTARADLQDARDTRMAAEQVVASHRQNLATLTSQYERGQVTRDRLVRELGYAKEDAEALAAAHKGLDQQISELDTAIANSQPDPAAQAEARQIIASLEAERDILDRNLRALSGTVQEVRV